MSTILSRRRRAWLLLAAGALGLASLAPVAAGASSHREAPQIAGLPQYDNTDTYALVSPDRPDSVTLVANWIPFEDPAGGPTFYPWATDARYEINVDNNGDARPDITYRWTFTSSYASKDTFLYNTGPVTSLADKDLNFWQSYRLEEIRYDGGRPVRPTALAKHLPVAPSRVGDASMPNYQALRDRAVRTLPGDYRSFVGQAEDPFFLDLRVFDLLYGGDLSEVGNDTLAGYNVNTVVLQVPTATLTAAGDPVVGVGSTTSRRNGTGQYVQVSRLGMPLVNEVIVPVRDKDRFNASQPAQDARFLTYVTQPEVPRLIEKIYGIKAPATPRQDLIAAFLTGVPGLNQPRAVTPSEQLRLNTSIPPTRSPKRLGVLDGDKAGFPNGRRLTDDVVDITLQVAEGELVGSPNDLGDKVDMNDAAISGSFPYVALPASGSATRARAAVKPGSAPDGGGTLSPAAAPARESGGMSPLVPIGAGALAGVLGIGGLLFWGRRLRGVPAGPD